MNEEAVGAKDTAEIEEIPSEEADAEASNQKYEISTYPADYTLEVLVSKFNKKQIKIPGFQRHFVWKQHQASRLIESFILGLPVPPIFLYTDSDASLLVIDGQQRLKSVAYFFEGYFGEESRGKRPVFKLTGFESDNPLADKTYEQLQESLPILYNKLNDSVLRALVIKQIDPDDKTSVHHIFERLNTGGTQLRGQEIRNCVYHGAFNDLLLELNSLERWRDIFGSIPPDGRQRDVEFILRFLALHRKGKTYAPPLKDFLSKFMANFRNPQPEVLTGFRDVFADVTNRVWESLGARPFHIRRGLNAASMESVYLAFSNFSGATPPNIKDQYKKLIATQEYLTCISSNTTDVAVLRKRANQASQALFGYDVFPQ